MEPPLPLHDFPDRAFRKLLEHPANLQDLLQSLDPGLTERLDFRAMEVLRSTFLVDDWREREADLLVRLPFVDSDETLLACILLEQQSQPNVAMPLRTLLYSLLYWEQEWKRWKEQHEAKVPLQLTPILPIVFYTGHSPWVGGRSFTELVGGPNVLRGLAPKWEPRFWELREYSPEELAESPAEWLAALAVPRAERTSSDRFQTLFRRVLQRIEPLAKNDAVRWHELLWFALSWAIRRRPGQERSDLLKVATESQSTVAGQQEVHRMSEIIEGSWEQELLARGEARGEAQGEARGRVLSRRDDLRLLLEERFGPLPQQLLDRIDSIDDIEELGKLFRAALRVTSLDQLPR